MKVETKLNIGDDIFFLHDKKVIRTKVQGIKIEVTKTDQIEVVYLCNSEADKQVNLKTDEKYSFKSKQDLIKSL